MKLIKAKKLKNGNLSITSGSTNDQLMCMAAFRYCLGRQSYIVGSCIDWLHDTWNQFEINTKFVILRDTIEALMDGQAGSPTYAGSAWLGFLREKYSELSFDEQYKLKQAVEWKKGIWPLDPEFKYCPEYLKER